ncbi:MAG TPA: dipeptide epimerase [bacterium]|nr:dipeptide epimerase [bacterium]
MIDLVDIQVVHTFKLTIPLKRKYTEAKQDYETVENILVSVNTDLGIVGWGCAAPDEIVTGETIENTYQLIREKIAPGLIECPATHLNKYFQMIEQLSPGAPAARAAIDIAIYDFWSKHLNCSVSDLIGTYRSSIPTSITIGIEDVQTTLDRAKEVVEEGFRIIKLKCGRDPEEDIERVKAIKKELGEQITIRIDANQGYDLKQAKKVIKSLKDDIEFIEQPVDAKDIDSLAKLAAESTLPVMADEAVLNTNDAIEVFNRGIPLINVKLMKSGGLTEARRICDLAYSLGKKVMIGCMDETHISMAAAAHLALSHPAVEYADLDGHLELDQHIVGNGIIIEKGNVYVTKNPGLGVEVRKKLLKDYQDE